MFPMPILTPDRTIALFEIIDFNRCVPVAPGRTLFTDPAKSQGFFSDVGSLFTGKNEAAVRAKEYNPFPNFGQKTKLKLLKKMPLRILCPQNGIRKWPRQKIFSDFFLRGLSFLRIF